ncbi:MAG: hypothetical protein ACUVUG_01405 [Candidatus Aminicenantia bacterium]
MKEFKITNPSIVLNAIILVDRKTGVAQHPKTIERVQSGAKFDLEIVLQIFEGYNE